MVIDPAEQRKLYTRAHLLAILTIYYNLVEGIVSVWAGVSDETLALFGFGVDSFIEVISAIGVWHMIGRIRANNGETKDAFELMAILNIYQQHKPVTTRWGIIISLLSVSFMWVLIHYKTTVGKALNSSAILADAACSRACVYLSVVLLVASVGYELTGLGYLDAIGALLIAWFAWKEGKESFDKAKGLNDTCGCCRV
jgi:hypothetical protein